VFLVSVLAGEQAFAVPAVSETASAAPTAHSDELEEVVVTANKREQSLNDVGLAIDVMSGEALKDRQITSLADIAQSIPGLSYTNSANGTPVYTLRGIGFYESSLGAYPTVSSYLDQVPLSFPVLTRHVALDLERVEVLKGPQGTLFGQNATGGAINYVPVKPSSDFAAGVELTYGRFNDALIDGFVNGPIGPTLNARLAMQVERADGWQESNSRPGDTNGAARNYVGRLLVDFTPGEIARFELNLNGWKDKGQTQAPQYSALQEHLGNAVSPALLASPLSRPDPRAADWTPGVPRLDNSMWQAALRGDITVFDSVTLTSLTSWVDFQQRQGDEGDGLPISTLDLPADNGGIESVAQELRLSNGAAKGLRWVVGGNFEHSKVDQEVDLNYVDAATHYSLGAIGYPIFSAHYSTFQKMTNAAGFGNLEFDATDAVTLKAGARYTDAKTTAAICNQDLSGSPTDVGPFFYNILLGGRLGPYMPQDCFAINDQPGTIGGVAPGDPGRYQASLHEHNVSWRTGIDWKAAPGMLYYVNVAKGYKAGGFPTVSASTFSQYLPVHQESVISYEAGFKGTFLDRSLQLNAAAFYYDYKDKQLRSKLNAQPFGILDVLQNIPKSNVKGVELELTALPVHGLVINANLTYLNATIEKFTGINAAGVAANFNGSPMPFTPKYQAGLNIDYNFSLTGSWNGFVGESTNYRSSTVAVVGGNVNGPTTLAIGHCVSCIDPYATLDLRAGVSTPDDKVRVWLWGKNVLNKYYWTNVVVATDTAGRYTGMPATYGISASWRY
jgi:outer membrane receptor protein involved in Fe transport